MKVAFFADILIRNFDGAARTMFQIIDRTKSTDLEFTFITGRAPEEDIGHEVFEVPHLPLPFNAGYSLALPVFQQYSLKKHLDAFNPDVIHIASPSILGNFALDYAEARGLPVISIYHTHFISYIPYYTRHVPVITEIAESAVIAGQRKFYNRCDLILVPTQTIIEELVTYGFHANKMIVWPRGIDHQIFNPLRKNKNLMNTLTHNKKPSILFASRLVWEKNLALLVRLYRLYEEKGEEVNFIIAGDGQAYADLVQKMPNATFTGKLSHSALAELYASTDVFVFPSISETYGNVVIEAMASGCPCVIADGGGSKSFVRQGINGFLANPEDENDFYRKIKIVLSSKTIREKIIQEGLDYVNDFDWASLVEKYFHYLRDLKVNQIAI